MAAVLITCSAIAIADDDSNGNIRVEVTKIDNTLQYVIIGIIAAVVVIAAVLSAVLVLRRPSTPRTGRAESVGLKSEKMSGFREDDYYEEVFSKPVPEVEIVDEKSKPVSFAALEPAEPEEAEGGNGVDRYLKEDERIIINVLRMKHNSCSQATLRVITDFSKARLSRILSELEERGIIYKEQQGRKNMITIKG
ncbi:hypothetical protein KY359_03140 [Candidatus Woesearchaeota archaeon]|nr:hypothetical protein [Candidatus Woesearchaeota archaeon]